MSLESQDLCRLSLVLYAPHTSTLPAAHHVPAGLKEYPTSIVFHAEPLPEGGYELKLPAFCPKTFSLPAVIPCRTVFRIWSLVPWTMLGALLLYVVVLRMKSWKARRWPLTATPRRKLSGHRSLPTKEVYLQLSP